MRPPPREAPAAKTLTSSRETPQEVVPDDEVVPPAKQSDTAEESTFKPTRRVREGPGGPDSLAGVSSHCGCSR